ncbi:MAG: bifunctional 23S rRNA (guanine(2069)-N(7))-methyltransferase RlmK/23S rRNA (guanine(2445)-N(2))-methyltransferase RlmL [Candidatus Methylomirabilia bacterium]
MHGLFATCPKGLEGLLAAELAGLGATDVKETVAGVAFAGTLETAYRACLWSRLASRILMTLNVVPAADAAALYAGVHDIPWEQHLGADGTLAVDFTGTSEQISHTLFGAQKVKDAVVDRFRERAGRRPSVDLRNPELRINVHLAGTEARVSLDLSGESLHKRGYHDESVEAPLKENLAAALLIRAGWPEIAAAGGPLLDPMCGSGSIAIEAALIAGDIAPGLLRESFGFLRWPRHDAGLWERLLGEARARRAAGGRRFPAIVGTDRDPAAVRAALANAARAGLSGRIHVEKRELADAVPPKSRSGAPGLVATNPPYGQRLGSETELRPLYEAIGAVLRERFDGWKAAILTGNPGLALRTGIRAKKAYTLFNGALECRLFIMDVTPERFMHASKPKAASLPGAAGSSPAGAAANVLSAASNGEIAESLANRLRKNLKTLGAWARREGISCYRLYDADMPEYAVAVDLYRVVDKVPPGSPVSRGGADTVHDTAAGAAAGTLWAIVQEYEAPKTVDPEKARTRLADAVATVAATLELPTERVVLKIRRQRRGREQHEKLGEEREFHRVEEGGLSFQVNFTDYLDTGLFLDTRPVRALLRTLAAGKNFLNLFCYTGTATVCAAAGAARSTVSVDLSQTYLGWAQRNLRLNGCGGREHELVRADCREWVRRERRRFGLIYLDPPAFSTSNAMRGTLDIQRDHVPLILDTAQLLEPGGALVFCTNLRRFKLDAAALPALSFEEITRATIPKDFAGNPRIHACWKVTSK